MLVNAPVNDEFAFDRAEGDRAPGLRGYLLDDRNTRHRDEGELLAKCYRPAGLPAPKLAAGEEAGGAGPG